VTSKALVAVNNDSFVFSEAGKQGTSHTSVISRAQQVAIALPPRVQAASLFARAGISPVSIVIVPLGAGLVVGQYVDGFHVSGMQKHR
jgi:hypothetical protein